MPPRRFAVLLAVIALLAAALRFTNLYWGLEHGYWFVDESQWVMRVNFFKAISWDSFTMGGLIYPPLYGYLVGLTGWAAAQCGAPVHTSSTAAVALVRTVGALASVLTVVVVGRAAAAMYGPWVGLAAAAFLAVAPLEAMQVHYTSLEPLLVLVTAVLLAASWRLVQRGTVGAAALAGAALGFATASKYTALVLGGAVLWAVVTCAWRARSMATLLRLGTAAAAGAAVALAVCCPPCVLYPDRLMKAFDFLSVIAFVPNTAMNQVSPTTGWWGRRWLHQLIAVLPYGLGVVLALAAAVGVLVALRRRHAADVMLLAALVPYFAYMGRFTNAYPRYVLPLFPGLVILAAAGLDRLAPRRAATALALVIVAYGSALTTSQVVRFSWDQQLTVGRWLGERLPLLDPADRTVGVPGTTDDDSFMRVKAPIEAHGFAVTVQRPNQWLAQRPAFFVLPGWLAISIRRDRHRWFMRRALDDLESGASGYRPVFRLPIPPYLQRPLDERLDPAFAVDLWQGAIGLTVYARDDVATRLGLASPQL